MTIMKANEEDETGEHDEIVRMMKMINMKNNENMSVRQMTKN